MSADLAYFKYTTSIESSDFTSLSKESNVCLIFEVTYSFAEIIIEFEGLNGIATKLFIVGLF